MSSLAAVPLAARPLAGQVLAARALGVGDDTWAADMLASYRALNPEQATWFDGAGAAVETELLARLQPGGYLHTTFGPDGQDKAACDFVFVLKTAGNVTARGTTKTGATLRWDIDGSVYTENTLPSHVLGVGAGVLTCSTTDGWSGLGHLYLHTNNFTGAVPNWSLPNVDVFLLYNNTFSGALPTFTLPKVVNFWVYVNGFSSISAPLPNLLKVADLQSHDNGLSQSEVDAALLAIYTARASYTNATPELDIAGTNAAPSGTYQYSATPSTGLEYIYALANDDDAEGFSKWTITYTDQAAAEWATDMLASYRTLNPEQATWFDAAGSAVETELFARLQPGGYLHTTFGPSGQNKLVCDFVFVLKTGGDVITKVSTKTGAALRWDIDGTVTVQNDLPAHTLGAGAGVLTCSTTDGWSGVTAFRINTNQFSGAAPLWDFPAVADFWINANQFSGAAPLWDLPAVTDFRIHTNQFSGAAPLWVFPNCLYFLTYTNQFSGAAPLWDFPFIRSFYIYSSQFSSISAPLPNLHDAVNLLLQNNGLSQSAVDAALLAIYNARATYTDTTPELNISGTNAAPSGTYQYSASPSTGLEYVYALANDDDAEGFNTWIITYTGGVAP